MGNIERLRLMLQPDVPSDDLLLVLLDQAAEIVLNRRYPFGIPSGAVVPKQYELTQCQIAVELFSKMGAEGQTAHDENGIGRTWEAGDVSPSLLKRIIPLAGSVSDA